MTTKNLAILGFVLSFFIPIAGIIIGIIAMNKMKNEGNMDGKGFAIAAIIIGAISMVLYIGMIACFGCIGAMAGASGY